VKKKSVYIRIFLLLFLLCDAAPAFTQGTKVTADPEDAYEHFKHGNYIMALKVYKVVYKTDPKNIDYNYKIALCYLNTNIDKKLAVPYLEFVTKQEKYNPEALFDLGRAYHYANRFDEAIKVFNKFKKDLSSKASERVDREIEMCKNGKELVKFPVKVTFENMREINSEYPDYYPFVTNDESLLAFTSRRKVNV
jgi:tetratricopeptide (TPR) repeat protein